MEDRGEHQIIIINSSTCSSNGLNGSKQNKWLPKLCGIRSN